MFVKTLYDVSNIFHFTSTTSGNLFTYLLMLLQSIIIFITRTYILIQFKFYLYSTFYNFHCCNFTYVIKIYIELCV